jgi:hypothetical protein
MTKEEVIATARKAGAFCKGRSGMLLREQYFEHFAELVRSDYSNKHSEFWLKQIDKAVNGEREACAKVCDDIDAEYNGEDVLATWCAQAIRARGSV